MFRTRGIRGGAVDYVDKPFDLDELLSRVSLRIDQARMIRQNRQSAVGSSLLAIGKVEASERVEDVVARVTAFTCELLNVGLCAMLLWREDERTFAPLGRDGLQPHERAVFNSSRLHDGNHPSIDQLIHDRRSLQAGNGKGDSLARLLAAELNLESLALVPIVHANQLRGLLVAGRRSDTRGFGDEDMDLLNKTADQAGMALANILAIEELEQQAITDGLTGLYNPRYLREFLTHQIARAQRSGERTSLLMLDLDNFKEINDRFGHPAGDNVLTAVSTAIRDSVRESDTVARFGGDEFAVVLIGASRRAADRVALRILRQVRGMAIDTGSGEVSITVSGGIAVAATTDDARSLIQAADSALYQAKAAGRDCIR
jgi:diguanylate cyclase (GGDEF)-like protein